MEKQDEMAAQTSSDEMYEFYCEFCNDEGLNIEADGYCTACGDYLCRDCIKHHKKNRSTRTHEVLDKNKMPKDSAPNSGRFRMDISTMCSKHKGEPVRFYCKLHDVLGCSLCLLKEHRTCQNVEDIPEKSLTVFDDTEYIDFINELETLRKSVQNINARSHENLKKCEQFFSEASTALQSFREEINTRLDEIELDLKTQADKIKKADALKADSISKTCTDLEETIRKITSEFEDLKSTSRVCQTFIRMKETKRDIQELKKKVTDTEEANIIHPYTFIASEKMKEYIKHPEAIGLISLQETRVVEDENHSSSPGIKPSASLLREIDVKSPNDTKTCLVNSSAVLSRYKLVVVDYKNDAVKVMNTQANSIIGKYRTNGSPWDVAVIEEDKIAVTIPEKKSITKLKIDGSNITKDQEINVKGNCYGIVKVKDKIAVTFQKPARVEILDLQGRLKTTIACEKDGNRLFVFPQYIAVNNDGNILYVSDTDGKRLLSLTTEGTVVAEYTDKQLVNPAKVCVDHRDNLFISGYYSRNVHMVSADCNKIKVILTTEDGLTSNVYSVSHCPETDRLYVGLFESNKVKTYQLSI